ncbi:hypothetical protein CsatA_016534 [Cannabis sativa]
MDLTNVLSVRTTNYNSNNNKENNNASSQKPITPFLLPRSQLSKKIKKKKKLQRKPLTDITNSFNSNCLAQSFHSFDSDDWGYLPLVQIHNGSDSLRMRKASAPTLTAPAGMSISKSLRIMGFR